jgi:hypothetical protein
MEKLISKLLHKLDENDDYILIFLLKEKIANENNRYNEKNSLSDNEMDKSRNEVLRDLRSFTFNTLHNNQLFQRLIKISEISDKCDECKRSTKKAYTYRGVTDYIYIPSENSKVCISCQDRCDHFSAKANKMQKNAEDSLYSITSNISDEQWMIFALIKKIRSKIWYLKRDGKL